jgi:hypothetical protein
MANTVTQRTLVGDSRTRNVVRHVHIVSDGTEESDLIVFNNSDFVNDTSKGRLVGLTAIGDSCVARLEWDQTADSPILSVDPANGVQLDFSHFGGVSNPNGSGATGDILLSTADLDAGDEITLILEIEQY